MSLRSWKQRCNLILFLGIGSVCLFRPHTPGVLAAWLKTALMHYYVRAVQILLKLSCHNRCTLTLLSINVGHDTKYFRQPCKESCDAGYICCTAIQLPNTSNIDYLSSLACFCWSIATFLHQWNSLKPLAGLHFASIVSPACIHTCTGVLHMRKIQIKQAPTLKSLVHSTTSGQKLPLISNQIFLFHSFHQLQYHCQKL